MIKSKVSVSFIFLILKALNICGFCSDSQRCDYPGNSLYARALEAERAKKQKFTSRKLPEEQRKAWAAREGRRRKVFDAISGHYPQMTAHDLEESVESSTCWHDYIVDWYAYLYPDLVLRVRDPWGWEESKNDYSRISEEVRMMSYTRLFAESEARRSLPKENARSKYQKGKGSDQGEKNTDRLGSEKLEALKTLGLKSGATKQDVVQAYRRLALVYHPDKGGDTEAFQRINEAKQLLTASV